MQISNWSQFHQSLQIEPCDGEPLPKPTFEVLNSFEAKHRIKLPRSYREYTIAFGAGELIAAVEIAAPAPEGISDRWDLFQFSQNHCCTEFDVNSYPAQDRDRAARLFFFGYEVVQHRIGWDFNDVRDKSANEYGIYAARTDRRVAFVASTFKEFIERTCDKYLVPDPEWDEEELGTRRAFRPATRQPL